MALSCDKCGGSRMNGSGMVIEDGDWYLSQHRPSMHASAYWCRSCVREHVADDYNPHE